MLKRDEAPEVPIPPRGVEVAVDVLATEYDVGRPWSQSVALELLEDLLVAAFLFGVIVGTIVVWTSTTLGLALIGGGLASTVVLGALPSSGIAEATTKYRHAVEQTQSDALASLRRRPSRAWATLPIFLGPAATIAGIVWLAWSQITTGEIRLAAIALIAIPNAAFWLWFAFDNISEYRYYSRVARLLQRFREESATPDETPIVVSKSELEVLSRAETHQIQRKVVEAAEELPEKLEESYSVSLAPETFDYLKHLAAENPHSWRKIAETLGALQQDPRPARARPAADVPGAVEVIAGDQGVEYRVDEDLHRIFVVAIAGGKHEDDDA